MSFLCTTSTLRLQRFIPLLLALLLLILTSCGVDSTAHNNVAQDNASQSYSYVATVDITVAETAANLVALYGGSVIAYEPESGFAILGFSEQDAAFTTLGKKKEANQDSLANPEVDALGYNVWSSGFNVWSSGFNVWSSGFNVWSSGEGDLPAPPADNQPVWNQIRLNEAYQLSQNLGQGVTVAILDTGLDLEHPMFGNRLTAPHTWLDTVDGDNYPQEIPGGSAYGHGTAVAGIVAQVAPLANILPIRVLDNDGRGDLSAVIIAVNHAIDMGADVINLSLGSDVNSDALLSILEHARNNGVFMIAAAGNNGQENGLEFPARYTWWSQVDPYLMSAGSVGHDNILSDFSAYGDQLSFVVPGENIVSAFPEKQLASFTGTSFATPILTGAVALAFGDTSHHNRQHIFDYLSNSVCCSELWQLNREQRGTDRLGQGLLDIPNLLRELPDFQEPDIQTQDPNFITNGDFETGSLSYWDSGNTDVAYIAQAGQHAAQLNAGHAWLNQWVNGLEPDTTYQLSLWLDRDASTEQVGISIEGFDSNGGGHHAISIWTHQDGFVSRSLEFTTGPYNTAAKISIWKNAGDATLIDSVRLVKRP